MIIPGTNTQKNRGIIIALTINPREKAIKLSRHKIKIPFNDSLPYPNIKCLKTSNEPMQQ